MKNTITFALALISLGLSSLAHGATSTKSPTNCAMLAIQEKMAASKLIAKGIQVSVAWGGGWMLSGNNRYTKEELETDGNIWGVKFKIEGAIAGPNGSTLKVHGEAKVDLTNTHEHPGEQYSSTSCELVHVMGGNRYTSWDYDDISLISETGEELFPRHYIQLSK